MAYCLRNTACKKTSDRAFHYYYYPTREKAERQLDIIRDLLGEKHVEQASEARVINDPAYPETAFGFLLSNEQHQALKTLQGHPRLVKSVRWDKLCFINDCILGATPSEKTHHRQALRRGLHKLFTTFFKGAYVYGQKPSPYPEENLPRKKTSARNTSQPHWSAIKSPLRCLVITKTACLN